jgi:hypothetical protein
MKLNQYLTAGRERELNSVPFRASLGATTMSVVRTPPINAMKSRAQLLAEIEDKRLENKEFSDESKLDSKSWPDALKGYDPYDNPGCAKPFHDGSGIAPRRRRAGMRNRRS